MPALSGFKHSLLNEVAEEFHDVGDDGLVQCPIQDLVEDSEDPVEHGHDEAINHCVDHVERLVELRHEVPDQQKTHNQQDRPTKASANVVAEVSDAALNLDEKVRNVQLGHHSSVGHRLLTGHHSISALLGDVETLGPTVRGDNLLIPEDTA